MPWHKTRATHYHSQLGLPDKSRVIKRLDVYRALNDMAMYIIKQDHIDYQYPRLQKKKKKKLNGPVAILKRVRKAIPKDLKCACSPKPWHGYSSLHSKLENKFYK